MKNKFCLKLVVSHTCAFIATSSFAGVMGTAEPEHRWYATLAATFMQPSNINYLERLAGPALPNFTVIDADHQTGLNASLGYFFRQQDDINVSYSYNHFNNFHSSSSSVLPTPEIFGYASSVSTNYREHYQALAVSIGHFINLDRWNTHWYVGLDFTRIHHVFHEISTSPDTTGLNVDGAGPPVTSSIRSPWKLYGVGPLTGIDLSYNLQNHFNLVGGASFALLTSYTNGEKTPSLGFNPLLDNFQYTRTSKTYNQALKTQAKIGLVYHQIINNNSPFSIEVGYRGTFVQDQIIDLSSGYSLSMHGPYLSAGLNL